MFVIELIGNSAHSNMCFCSDSKQPSTLFSHHAYIKCNSVISQKKKKQSSFLSNRHQVLYTCTLIIQQPTKHNHVECIW